MTTIAGIGFTAPWLLLALLALPLLWLLLRAVPPAPRKRLFPAVTLLLGLRDDDSLSDRTPWWLLLLRLLAVAAAIIGLAGPVLNPTTTPTGRGPLLVVLDGSWAGAPDWDRTREEIDHLLAEAGRADRPVAVLRLTAPQPPQFQSAASWRRQIIGEAPQAWQPTPEQLARAGTQIDAIEGGFDSLWFSDGLEYAGRDDLLAALRQRGRLTVYEHASPRLALRPVVYVDGAMEITVVRSSPQATSGDGAVTTSLGAGADQTVTVLAKGPDPGGTMRTLGSVTVDFADPDSTSADGSEATARLSLPAELRARIRLFELQGQNSAGAVSLADDGLRRREVALISAQSGNEGLALLSPLHYLRKALAPTADLLEGGLSDLLPANPDVIVLADTARLPPDQETAVVDWVNEGGLLLRFAGPRLAASDTARTDEEPLLPVRLRIGGRSIGGAMSWGEPKTLAPFAEDSPFFGLSIPPDVTVSSQVVAQPDPSLAERVIAELSDGTPLVTRKPLGNGQIVLFHVTANAEWSSLPLSGLFVQMMERLAISSGSKPAEAVDLDGTTWAPLQVLDGFGALSDADALPGVAGPDLIAAPAGPELQPGLYQNGDRRIARNVIRTEDQLTPAQWPLNVPVNGYGATPERPLGGLLISFALLLLALDVLASLLLSGLLSRPPRTSANTTRNLTSLVLLATSVWVITPGHDMRSHAQGNATTIEEAAPSSASDPAADALAAERAAELTLAHVLTGNPQVDQLARDGLQGLSNTLRFRTSVEPAPPASVDLERDELAFYPLLYWPVTANQAMPSGAAYDRLNTYLRTGGMILFDTRDADLTRAGASSPAGRRLQQLALRLDVPPLEPLPADHVLTRAFYLLQDFPGRYSRGAVWVEAAPADAQQVEGIPFRNLNDGVTPVVIGGNDWAAAWAVDDNGRPLLPVGRGYAGERQRELAYRFGVNLVMHVLTGNYKSDQVHVPALLDRLGQ
ncbi:DUF4159 domain-containing protein [Phaeobacter gallaeciensis]|uniref:Double-transmembrane domain protein n=1 Tax=Phaeobacter gallaeciensis TaxID=60890 RepID=A0AAC9Z5Z4_9RHOB|nr:DUF4159 domain-containing protein [Phaeobacter gallaeciensis]AHD07867.1 double-transmembrane domain protein [Phaeobacter gallaeciensis DSM 26640]ATE91135.1 double-transmembrane domain protein [Phaeobacter gallaeciensis]ATE95410.1 double-transmembrane domain protein [Phaeobacter gallaeciensis]ATE99749.1 double-transmembrane domain protein [Phaeobacter gallaeciensis]ATF04182.1 double-transmembrane domain protein [Phaeobacter gallaeciensis]